MLAQVHRLPALLRDVFDAVDAAARSAVPDDVASGLERLYVTGCGDSHHVALSTEHAFEALAGVPTEPQTALQAARFTAQALPATGGPGSLVIGISVSGSVARTAEALALARAAGAQTLALTAAPDGRLAQAAQRNFLVQAPDFADPTPNGTPGVRSYALNQLAPAPAGRPPRGGPRAALRARG